MALSHHWAIKISVVLFDKKWFCMPNLIKPLSILN